MDNNAKTQIIKDAVQRGLVGGTSGAMAMTIQVRFFFSQKILILKRFCLIQVSTLMWMRTTMNYQYRYGTSTTEAMKHLWREGKIRRFYRGYGPALLQGPISRFGDTAANVGILALLESNTELPIALKTGAASITAGVWRIFIMPIDTVKTTLQVIGTFQALKQIALDIRFRQ